MAEQLIRSLASLFYSTPFVLLQAKSSDSRFARVSVMLFTRTVPAVAVDFSVLPTTDSKGAADALKQAVEGKGIPGKLAASAADQLEVAIGESFDVSVSKLDVSVTKLPAASKKPDGKKAKKSSGSGKPIKHIAERTRTRIDRRTRENPGRGRRVWSPWSAWARNESGSETVRMAITLMGLTVDDFGATVSESESDSEGGTDAVDITTSLMGLTVDDFGAAEKATFANTIAAETGVSKSQVVVKSVAAKGGSFRRRRLLEQGGAAGIDVKVVVQGLSAEKAKGVTSGFNALDLTSVLKAAGLKVTSASGKATADISSGSESESESERGSNKLISLGSGSRKPISRGSAVLRRRRRLLGISEAGSEGEDTAGSEGEAGSEAPKFAIKAVVTYGGITADLLTQKPAAKNALKSALAATMNVKADNVKIKSVKVRGVGSCGGVCFCV